MEIKLTDREADLMEVLWRRGPSTVAEVRDSLADDLAYTTVLTMLRTLEEKGYVAHEQEGRAHRYAAIVEREVARRSALKTLKRKLFQGSTGLLLAQPRRGRKAERRRDRADQGPAQAAVRR